MFFVAPLGAMSLLRQIRKPGTGTIAPCAAAAEDEDTSTAGATLLALRTDPTARRIFGIVFAAVGLLVFGANALAGLGLYTVIVVGTVKSVFVGLLAAVGVLSFRSRRKSFGPAVMLK